MNQPKHQLTSRTKKKIMKEVRSAIPEPASKIETPLSKYPKKIQKKEEVSLKALSKAFKIKAKKKKSHLSKRTTPGKVTTVSAPHVVHTEGKRWIKTLKKQTQAKKKIATVRALKRK